VARILGVQDREIYFTNNATSSCATAIWGTFLFYKNNFFLNSKNKNKNQNYTIPHIVTSNIEHAAVLENIRHLEMLGEIEASYINVDEFGIIKTEDVIKEI
jgi:hypothetical protein